MISYVVLLLVILASFFVVVQPKNVYADSCFEYGEVLNYNDVEISDNGVRYSDRIDENTAIWTEDSGVGTLTLNEYDGGHICIDGSFSNVNLVLNGENKISGSDDFNQDPFWSNSSVTVNGGGSLTIVSQTLIDHSKDGDFGISIGDVSVIESGDVSVIQKPTASDGCSIVADRLKIVGGKLHTECAVELGFGYYQNGGVLEISHNANNGAAMACLGAYFMVFDGGTTSISCQGAPSIFSAYDIGQEELLDAYTVEINGNVRRIVIDDKDGDIEVFAPLHGAMLFNRGDITLNSDIAAAMVFADEYDEDSEGYVDITDDYLAEKGKDYFIMMADDMAIDSPKTAIIDAEVSRYDGRSCIFSSFTNGSEGIGVQFDSKDERIVAVSDNVLKTAHIVKSIVPVPDTDGDADGGKGEEANPNTADSQIAALAFGVLCAIITEGIIIADLYRRLFSYEKEIANVEWGLDNSFNSTRTETIEMSEKINDNQEEMPDQQQ